MSAGWVGVSRLGGLGDDLITASVLKPLKRLGYKVEVITSGTAGAVFQNNPHIDKLSIRKEEITDWVKWFKERGGEYEQFFNLSHSCENRHALFVGSTAFWWPADYRRKLCAGSYIDTVCDIVGVQYEHAPLFYPTDEERDRALKSKEKYPKGPYVAWVVSGSRIDKIYPYAAMAIGRIIRELNMPVVMIGTGAKQYEYAKQIHEHVIRQNGDDDGLHLALSPETADPGGHQSWPLRRSLTQAMYADLVITPDTGIAWAVAMEEVPKIMMLSHASVENITTHWRKTISLHADPYEILCSPCHRLHDDISTCTPNKDGGHAAACISDISVELLLTAARAALGSKSSYDEMLKRWPSRVTLQDFSVK